MVEFGACPAGATTLRSTKMKTHLTLIGICALPIVSHALGELPPEVKVLSDRRDAKIKEVDVIYASELLKLQRKYMNDGNLEAANQVDALIKNLNTSPEKQTTKKPTTSEELSEFLPGTVWGEGEKLTFAKDGKFTQGRASGKYVVTGPRTIMLIWRPDLSIRCEFDEDFSLLAEKGGLNIIRKLSSR